jgi:hypothetical protein
MAGNKFTARQFIEAMPETGGVVSVIAEKVGCAWNTAKKYIDTRPTVRRAWLNERNRITDRAKHNIIIAIEGGDLQMSKWWVQVMDDDFRPLQRHEITGKDGGPVEHRDIDAQERIRAISSLADALATGLCCTSRTGQDDMDTAEQTAVAGAAQSS